DRVTGGSEKSGSRLGTATAPAAGEPWFLETGNGSMAPRTAIDVLNDVREKVATGELADYEPVPLGMAPLDKMLGGGIRPGELLDIHRRRSGERRMVLIVDYLQKVPQFPEPQTESEKVTYVVNGLKDIALSEKLPTIAIVAADKEGLKAARLRNHHLRGSSAI